MQCGHCELVLYLRTFQEQAELAPVAGRRHVEQWRAANSGDSRNDSDGECWTLACSAPANTSIDDGTTFVLRTEDTQDGDGSDVITLSVVVRRLPKYRLLTRNN